MRAIVRISWSSASRVQTNHMKHQRFSLWMNSRRSLSCNNSDLFVFVAFDSLVECKYERNLPTSNEYSSSMKTPSVSSSCEKRILVKCRIADRIVKIILIS
jgi:hypothetical protein